MTAAELEGDGDCYVVAYELVVDHPDTYLLCHGWPTGQGPIAGLVHGHAWVEYETDGYPIVVERSNGHDLELPADLYYAIGHINPDHIVRYTAQEARAAAVEHGTYGPWNGEPE
jgi:hypothetical protein